MTEIEKMFKNAGINKIRIKRCSGIKQSICQHNCNKCESFDCKYPPFTAEKQIKLIKWLAIKGDFDNSIDIAKNTYDYWTIYFQGTRWTAEGFEESLAGLINSLWQDLTDQEKEETRGILNENS